jgi:hypothetical protein
MWPPAVQDSWTNPAVGSRLSVFPQEHFLISSPPLEYHDDQLWTSKLHKNDTRASDK